MHLIVPFAAPLSEAGRPALRELVLPNLAALWPSLAETARDAGEASSLSTPHERALAAALGVPVADGLVPTAAWMARRAGLSARDAGHGWALLTPANWQAGADSVSLADPADLALDEAQSQALLQAVSELFVSEGFVLHAQGPTTWLAAHESLADLPTASLDRVVGRKLDGWLLSAGRSADRGARLVRRLQNEVQMLLHTHPLNAEREARGQLPVNSVWISGTGPASDAAWPAALQLDERLRAPALREDWFAWSRAWAALDAGPIAEALARTRRGEPVTLVLCGERSALTLQASTRPRGLWQRLTGPLRGQPDLAAVLEPL